MSLTLEKIATLKSECMTSLSAALGEFVGNDVGELHKAALDAAGDVRGKNELAYVQTAIDNKDDSAFTVKVDLTSGKGDSFYATYNVVPYMDGVRALFVEAGDIKDAPDPSA